MTPAAGGPVPVMAEESAVNATAPDQPPPHATATATATAEALGLTAEPIGAMLPEGRFTGHGVKGLTFQRRWTTPGVHPYDEITWELRTAEIKNESGKTVFEQKDVEVPTFWSQLATNVVVSKYFRGHIGTAERERSVKQLIDRVVNTHRRLGRDAALLRAVTKTSPRSRRS